jgi:hypothetical protein
MDLSERLTSVLNGIPPAECALILSTLAARYAAAACAAAPPPALTAAPDRQPEFYTTDEAATVLRCSKKVLYGLTRGLRFRKRVGKELRFEKQGFDSWAVARLN